MNTDEAPPTGTLKPLNQKYIQSGQQLRETLRKKVWPMTIYYYELENGSGQFAAENDEAAIKKVGWMSKLLCLYKESDTPDGTPFIIVLENVSKQIKT